MGIVGRSSFLRFELRPFFSLSEKELADELRALSLSIEKNGLPAGTFFDPGNVVPRKDSILVPFGSWAAVYKVAKNGTAKLETVLDAAQVQAARQKLGL